MSQQINLYNALFLKQEKHFSARTMVQALGLIALGVAALWVYAALETSAAEQSVQQYRAQLATQRDQLVKLTGQVGAQARSKALEVELARLESEAKAKQATLETLNAGELGNTSGFSEFFAAFGRQALAGVWLTGFTIGDSGNELVVNGRALRAELVPTYLAALSGETMMRGRRVTEMKLAAKEQAATRGAPPREATAQPERFIEFNLTAPLRLPSPPPGAKP